MSWGRVSFEIVRQLGASAALVLAYIDDADGGRGCWAKNSVIGEALGMAPRTVRKAKRDLEAQGLIRRQQQVRNGLSVYVCELTSQGRQLYAGRQPDAAPPGNLMPGGNHVPGGAATTCRPGRQPDAAMEPPKGTSQLNEPARTRARPGWTDAYGALNQALEAAGFPLAEYPSQRHQAALIRGAAKATDLDAEAKACVERLASHGEVAHVLSWFAAGLGTWTKPRPRQSGRARDTRFNHPRRSHAELMAGWEAAKERTRRESAKERARMAAEEQTR